MRKDQELVVSPEERNSLFLTPLEQQVIQGFVDGQKKGQMAQNFSVPHEELKNLCQGIELRFGSLSGAVVFAAKNGHIDGAKLPEATRPLTDCEFNVLILLSDGLNQEQIAQFLGVSSRTIDSRRTNIFNKLGINNQYAAVAMVALGRVRVGRLKTRV